MSYMAGQALLRDLVATNSLFSGISGIATEGDLKPLDSGLDQMVALFPSAVPQYDLAGLRRQIMWQCILELYVKFSGDETYNTFGTTRDSLISTIEDDRCMSGTYWVTGLSSGDMMEVRDEQGGGPFFLMQQIMIDIRENI